MPCSISIYLIRQWVPWEQSSGLCLPMIMSLILRKEHGDWLVPGNLDSGVRPPRVKFLLYHLTTWPWAGYFTLCLSLLLCKMGWGNNGTLDNKFLVRVKLVNLCKVFFKCLSSSKYSVNIKEYTLWDCVPHGQPDTTGVRSHEQDDFQATSTSA